MKFIIGNWKMHTTPPEAVALAGRIEEGLTDLVSARKNLPTVVLCPPATVLTDVRDVLDPRVAHLGIQNIHWDDSGKFTGEIAAPMVKGLVEYAIIGHSERRKMGESDQNVSRKVAAAVRNEIRPIVCVGERETSDIATEEAENELRTALEDVDPKSLAHLIVAYEPVWAVGTGQPADNAHVAEVVKHLREVLKELDCEQADVVYGGSVNPQTLDAFLGIPHLEGLLIGEASLDSQSFLTVIGKVAEHYGNV